MFPSLSNPSVEKIIRTVNLSAEELLQERCLKYFVDKELVCILITKTKFILYRENNNIDKLSRLLLLTLLDVEKRSEK